MPEAVKAAFEMESLLKELESQPENATLKELYRRAEEKLATEVASLSEKSTNNIENKQTEGIEPAE